jgi:hypothetical protein
MESSHTADLDIPELNAAASKAHALPGMAHQSLLSVGQLCDEGYIVTFQQETVTICNSDNSKLLSGPRDANTSLWRMNLKQLNKTIPDPIANNVYELCNKEALVHYLHKALFSPTKTTMLQAVKDGHLITWPGLPEHAISVINWFRLTVVDTILRNAPSGLSRNTLWPGSPQLTPPSQYTCGTDSCHNQNLL